ncbi:DUF3500 domain-containing protein [Phytoactinopolyspora limicola]|uniref:DUF3500 domain-containing protein n=1 Tax=Phytoactinopolyspora limicola TaxID=2715536 RepID=UPI001409C196|nr:DUF3500 domain-containing protein [Phytoactinopolyspora limicola]
MGPFAAEARAMSNVATALLRSLGPVQKAAAIAPVGSADYHSWSYLPGTRPGVMLGEMIDYQQSLAMELLDAGCSPIGARTACGIIELDAILRGERRRGQYWIRVFGAPGDGRPWAWRINGHHLALHLTIVDDDVAVPPNFFGAEPATVAHGPHQGLRTPVGEEENARALLASFDDDQRQVAIATQVAPSDILTRADPVADPGVLAEGLTYAQMYGEQRRLVEALIRLYIDRAPHRVAGSYWRELVAAGMDAVAFRWAGSDERGAGHYYAVNGPTFLIEYDNTQDNANHIHSVWRDLRRDWGEDLLAAHYANHHHPDGDPG